MAFRQAHEISGKVVSRAEQLGIEVTQVPLQELQTIRYNKDVFLLFVKNTIVEQQELLT